MPSGGRIIVHAGNYKTGSTAIQSFLWKNLSIINSGSRLRIPGLSFAPAAHSALCSELLGESREAAPPCDWAGVIGDIKSNPRPKYLLSSEVFIRVDPEKLLEKLSTTGVRTKQVYFYLRPHIQMFVSSYIQAVKEGVCHKSILDVYPSFLQRAHIDFCPRIRSFARAFGPKNVNLREYRPASFPHHDVVLDFLSFTGLSGLVRFYNGAEDEQANPTPTAEITDVLRFVSKTAVVNCGVSPRNGLVRRMLSQVRRDLEVSFAALPQSRLMLPLDLQNDIKNRFEPARRVLTSDLMGGIASEDWFDEPVVKPTVQSAIPVDLVRSALINSEKRFRRNGEEVLIDAIRVALVDLPWKKMGATEVFDTEAV